MKALRVGRHFAPSLALWRKHRVEAVLSVLGIFAGVGGLVAVVALGEGTRQEIDRALGALGTSTVVVRSLSSVGIPAQRMASLERLLGGAVRQQVPVAERVTTSYSPAHDVPATKVIATNRAYADLYRLRLNRGRFIAAHDSEQRQRVCVLGAVLARELYPRGDALGARIRLDGDWYRVVGVLARNEPPAGSETTLPEVNRLAIVPLPSRWPSQFPEFTLNELLLRFSDDVDMAETIAAVKRIIEHGVEGRHFEYIIPLQLIHQRFRMQRVVAGLLLGTTLVLLGVGGISIANVMLMNVLRRSGEIGLRRAVGATRRHIVEQFLTESMLVCALGGILGVLAGLVCVVALSHFSGWPVAAVPVAVVGGFAASIMVGVAAGGYPAWQATRVDPIQALTS